MLEYRSPIRLDVDPNTHTVKASIPGTNIRIDQLEALKQLPGVPIRDWLAELDIPKDWDKIEAMARPRGFGWRRLTFIIADESPLHFPGQPRLRPGTWTFRESGQMLILAHLQFAVGVLQRVWLAQPGEVTDVEGQAILGEAALYNSPLAEATWLGIQRGIFTGVSPIVIRNLTDPFGGGELLEVGIGDNHIGPKAKLLRTWDWRAEALAKGWRKERKSDE